MTAKDEARLQVLLSLYQTERQDNQTAAQIMVGIVGAMLAFVAVVAAAVELSATPVEPRVLAFAPLIPLLLMSWLMLYVSEGLLRRDYLVTIESAILGEISSQWHSDSRHSWTIPSWFAATTDMWAPKLWSRKSAPYTLAIFVLNAGAAISVVAFVVDILVHLRGDAVAFWIALVVYVPIMIILAIMAIRTVTGSLIKWFKV